MNMNEIIRKYRKEQNLTQEQVANQLGVSAPAVNKWENGISYPDITLLSPLARLLKTDVDTLLSFHEELSEKEIVQFINTISEEIMNEGFESAFQKVVEKIKEYPNCEKLILYSAQVLNGYLVMKLQDIGDKEKYQKQITAWFQMIAFGDDVELAKSALVSLAQSLMKEEKYEEAQKLLDRIPPLGFDKRLAQTQLYVQKEMYEDAYKVLDEMVYQQANGLASSLMYVLSALCKQKNYPKALFYAEKISKVADMLDLGTNFENSSYFTIYLEMRDKEKTLDALERMLDGFMTMRDAKDSDLYRHIKFNEDDGLSKMKEVLIKSFSTDASIDFIREEERFKKLVDNCTK